MNEISVSVLIRVEIQIRKAAQLYKLINKPLKRELIQYPIPTINFTDNLTKLIYENINLITLTLNSDNNKYTFFISFDEWRKQIIALYARKTKI